MNTVDLTPVSTEEISVEEFLRLKKDGKLAGVHIQGIGASKLGRSGSFGTIRIKRNTPIYRLL
jgi:hypothetical protein